MLRLLLALALIGAAPPLLCAQQHVEEPLALQTQNGTIEGRIDWTEKVLIAYGEAVAPEEVTDPVRRRLMGFRAAKTVAYRNLLELVGQVQVDAETRVSNLMLQSDSVRTHISGVVRGARVEPGSQVESEGLYRIALRLGLVDRFAEAVLPDTLPAAPARPALPAEAPAIYTPRKPYTGLLIDARGLDLQPSMSPRVLGEDGRLVYSATTAGRGYATRMGVVGYARDFEAALRSDRLGGEKANPLVVKALKVAGLYNADLILSREDAVRSLVADMDEQFLRECRVVFALGPEPAADSLSTDPAHLDSTLGKAPVELPGQAAPGRPPQ